jgi:asparagine synthase (glutamine-hydrolysing)
VPFLDEMVLDRVVPLHADRKIVGGQLKSLLIPIVRRLLPREVWDRPKQGFHVPLDRFMAGLWRPAIEAALEWGEGHCLLFNYPYLRHLHAINTRQGGVSRELWNPFVFLAWAKAHSYSL